MQDTFYITEEILLRTHTSPVQARCRCSHDFKKRSFNDSPQGVCSVVHDDATHQFLPNRRLGCWENISMADLQRNASLIVQKCLAKRQIRFRPSYFPFTEPICWSWMFPSSVVEKAVTYVNQVGSNQGAVGTFYPRVLEMRVRCDCLSGRLGRQERVAIPATESTISVDSTKGMSASQNSLNKIETWNLCSPSHFLDENGEGLTSRKERKRSHLVGSYNQNYACIL